jgi:pyridoxamine 5'-phosphate oxidase
VTDPAASSPDLAGLRVSYDTGHLLEGELAGTPLAQFRSWLADVAAAQIPEPNAMVLSTIGADAQPSGRTVLLKDVDARGFVFFTNYGSRKGRELSANPKASLVFPWFAIHRQVVVVGQVEQVGAEETANYFRSRPRASQLGAWSSHQSEVLPDRLGLEQRFAELAARWPDEVPVPDFWGGFLLRPISVEFWVGRRSRLHDRLRFVAVEPGPLDQADHWSVERLSP